MAIFTAAATGSSMFTLFSFAPGFANFPIGSISGTAFEATVTSGSGSHVLVYSGSSLGWTGLAPDAGTYTSIQVTVSGTLNGTLSGFSAQNFADITVGAGTSPNAFSMLNGNDTLNGGAGADSLFGGFAGSDTFNGNGGNDSFFVAAQFSFPQPAHVFNGDAGSDDTVVVLAAPSGLQVLDFIGSTFTSIENISVADGVSAAIYTSQIASGEISTAAQFYNFTVNGRLDISIDTAGVFDMTQFGGGIDQLRVNGSADADTVTGSNSFGEILRGFGGNDNLAGGAGNDTLFGGSNDDTLNGDFESDTLLGGTGDDLLDGGSETDIAQYYDATSSVIVSLAAVGAQAVGGGLGLDTLLNIENLSGSGFDDTLTGNDGVNVMYGESGNDTLIGGALNDDLFGGAGDDTFDVDVANDVVHEFAGEGTKDTVRSGNLNLDLANYSNIENLALTGALSRNLTGNVGANVLTGNAGNNILNGKGGSDKMYGGTGNDTFYVDAVGDSVFESALASGGVDRIITAISQGALDAGVENLVLTGATAIIGIGNSLGNVINGSTNTAANSLRGMAGNDIYVLGVGDTVNETVAGSSGIDTVQSAFTQTLAANVERLLLTGNTAVNGTGNGLANILTGNTAVNILNGGVGVDTLVGGLGIDTLRGGDALQDRFQYNALNETGDIISDFDTADMIVLKASAFLGLTNANKAANFVVQANNHNAVDANDRLIFNQADDTLWYDSNGSLAGGTVVKIADLNIAFDLSAADILMI